MSTKENLSFHLFNSFVFLHPEWRPADNYIYEGMLPWWINPETKWAFFRPISALSHYIDFNLLKLTSYQALIENGILQSILSLISWIYFNINIKNKVKATITSLFFTLLCVQFFDLYWLSNRNMILAMIFAILSSISLYLYLQNNKKIMFFLAILSYVLAILSTEFASVFAIFFIFPFLNVREKSHYKILFLYLLVFICWFLFYRYMGYGTEMAAYLNPVQEPIRFAKESFSTFLVRIPIIVGYSFYVFTPLFVLNSLIQIKEKRFIVALNSLIVFLCTLLLFSLTLISHFEIISSRMMIPFYLLYTLIIAKNVDELYKSFLSNLGKEMVIILLLIMVGILCEKTLLNMSERLSVKKLLDKEIKIENSVTALHTGSINHSHDKSFICLDGCEDFNNLYSPALRKMYLKYRFKGMFSFLPESLKNYRIKKVNDNVFVISLSGSFLAKDKYSTSGYFRDLSKKPFKKGDVIQTKLAEINIVREKNGIPEKIVIGLKKGNHHYRWKLPLSFSIQNEIVKKNGIFVF